MIEFKGKTVWITGATSGIGKALAIKLASLGANLILSSRREKELEEVRGLFTSAIKILDAMPKKPKKKGFWNFIKCLLK